jgi:uncharacterized protein YcbK (DUF882 family)
MGLYRSTSKIARRNLLTGAFAASGLLAAGPLLAAVPLVPASRRLAFQNLHTGEKLASEYWAEGRYIPGGLEEIANVLRDHRSGAVHAIDPTLLDLLHDLQAKLEVQTPFHVISGYRSPASNANLASASSGVAKRSMHMDGKAIDIRMPGVDLGNLHKAAKAMQGGGVGLYTSSNFVHLDVGRVRYW